MKQLYNNVQKLSNAVVLMQQNHHQLKDCKMKKREQLVDKEPKQWVFKSQLWKKLKI